MPEYPLTRDVLVPSVTTEREEYVNDHSVSRTVHVSWLYRRVTVEWSRPFSRREARRIRAAHDAEMARIRAAADARLRGATS